MASRAKKKRRGSQRKKRTTASNQPRCGLCGATKNLTKTECCDQWICDDEHEYEVFSYARNSCHRNHSRYTLCGFHFTEEHSGNWKDCDDCRAEIETEMYVYYGTNEYNFEVLENPPEYEPTKCIECGTVIVLAEGGYSSTHEGCRCGECTAARFPRAFGKT